MVIYKQTDRKLVVGDPSGFLNIFWAYIAIVLVFVFCFNFFYFSLSDFTILPWEELYRPIAYLLGIPLLILVGFIFLIRRQKREIELTKKMEFDKQTGMLTITTRTQLGKNQQTIALSKLKSLTFLLILDTVISRGIGSRNRSVHSTTAVVPRLQFELSNGKTLEFESRPSIREDNDVEYLEYEDADWDYSPLLPVAKAIAEFLHIPLNYPKSKGKAYWPKNTEKRI